MIARRHSEPVHGSGSSSLRSSQVVRCSTPEGIGAATTSVRRPCPWSRSSAQRPKASERRRRASVGRQGLPGRGVLNARRHRSGDAPPFASSAFFDSLRCSTPEGIGAATTTPARRGSGPPCRCSTPEGIGAATTPARRRRRAAPHRVLNARRHRSGDDTRRAARRSRSPRGAQRPKASERRRLAQSVAGVGTIECSTPEGIGAATTARSWRPSRRTRPVLNARRHRSGDDAVPRRGHRQGDGVLNARRHRSGDDRAAGSSCTLTRSVLNARRHRSGDDSRWRRTSPAAPTSAQRPKASERRRRRRGGGRASGATGAQRPKASERRRPVVLKRPDLVA